MAQTLQSVTQALRVLTELQSREAAGVTELAEALDIGPSTVHRLLTSLLEHAFVERATGRRYRLGSAMRLSPDAAAIEHCIEVGHEVMKALRDASAETVHISVLDGARSKFVAAIESPHMMRVTSRVGRRLPAHTSAAGKALLAELPTERLHAVYPHEHLPRVTDRSVDSRTQLETELELTRSRGYGRNFGESEADLAALAVVIRRPSGVPLCSLTLTGPISRINPGGSVEVSDRELELVDLLKRHAAQLEQQLEH